MRSGRLRVNGRAGIACLGVDAELLPVFAEQLGRVLGAL